MKRKLLNGLLALAVAAGGVGTFTSCKDEDFRNDLVTNQLEFQKQLEAIRNVSDPAFRENLQKWLNDWTYNLSGSGFTYEQWVANYMKFYQDYEAFYAAYQKDKAAYEAWKATIDSKLAELDTLYAVYQAILTGNYANEDAAALVQGIYDWMFNEIFPNEDWFQEIKNIKGNRAWLEVLDQRATSVEINQVKNPVFGTVNLPIGLKSTVLATYLYDGKGANMTNGNFTFPNEAEDALIARFDSKIYSDAFKVISQIATGEALKSGDFTGVAEGDGNMGNAYININPTNFDYKNATVSLVDATGQTVLDDVTLTPNTDQLYFNMSRADENTGIFKAQVNAPEDYTSLKFDFPEKSEIVSAVKNVLTNRHASDIAYLGEVIYEAMSTTALPAYAVKVAWEEDMPVFENGSYQFDENGEVVTQKVTNAVLSSFDLAATVIHPLSYSTSLGGLHTGFRMPHISPVEYYLEKINNKLDDIKIDGIPTIGEVTIQLNAHVTDRNVETGELLPTEDEDGNPIGWIVFEYRNQETGETAYGYVSYNNNGLNADPEALDSFVNAILEAANIELTNDINYKMITELNKAFDNINENIINMLNARLDDLKNRLEEIMASKKLSKIDDLIKYYNKLADRVNDFLDQPEFYLQTLLAVETDGGIEHVSTDAAFGSRVPAPVASNSSIMLYTTSYTGDVVVPSYKKYVAITAAKDANGNAVTDLKSLNSNAGLNQVYDGIEQKVAMNVSGLAGYQLTVSYVSVDYHGNCSMSIGYLTVAK